MDSQQSARSSAEFSTGQKPPMVKQNPPISINLQNQQTQPQSSVPHLVSSGPRFPPPTNNLVDGPPRFQHPGGPPPLRHLDNRSQLNPGGPQGQFPSPRPPYGPPLQRIPPPRNVFFGRPPPPGSLPGGPPPHPSSLPGGPPPHPSSLPGGPPPHPSSLPGGPPPHPSSLPGGPPPHPSLLPGGQSPHSSSLTGGQPPHPNSLSSGPPHQQGSIPGGQPPHPSSLPSGQPLRFPPRQPLPTGPQGQVFGPRPPPQHFNQPGFNNRPPFQSPGIPTNDPRIPNRGLQRNNSVGGITTDPRVVRPNFALDQRQQQYDWRNQFRPQSSVDRMENINDPYTTLATEFQSKSFTNENSDSKVEDKIMSEDALGNIKSESVEVKGFDNGQIKSLSSAESINHQSPKSSNIEITKIEIDDNNKQEDPITADTNIQRDSVINTNVQENPVTNANVQEDLVTNANVQEDLVTNTNVQEDPVVASTTTLKKSPSIRSIKADAENDSGVDESTQRREIPKMNGIAGSPKKSRDGEKRSTAGSPIKSPSKSIKSIPKTPDASPSAIVQDKKKVPMNKIQVGNAPSPNLKSVTSKIGSLANVTHKPGGGKFKIENKKIDFSKAQPKIAAKNDKYKPGGGDKKIETVKLDFKDKAKPRVGSKDNAKHVPGGGSVKSSLTSSKMLRNNVVNIETQKIEFKAESKIGSLDNVKHKPGGGDKKIFNKSYGRQSSSSNVGSVSGSGSQSPIPSSTGAITDKNGFPTSDENLNQEC